MKGPDESETCVHLRPLPDTIVAAFLLLVISIHLFFITEKTRAVLTVYSVEDSKTLFTLNSFQLFFSHRISNCVPWAYNHRIKRRRCWYPGADRYECPLEFVCKVYINIAMVRFIGGYCS